MCVDGYVFEFKKFAEQLYSAQRFPFDWTRSFIFVPNVLRLSFVLTGIADSLKPGENNRMNLGIYFHHQDSDVGYLGSIVFHTHTALCIITQ